MNLLCSFSLFLGMMGLFGQSIAHAAVSHPTSKPSTKDHVGFVIKPSNVQLPANAKLGQYERTIRPYQNGWTLICDVNLLVKRKTCNVTQNITDTRGQEVFSWSLAATEEGQPIMILRVPTSTRGGIAIDPLDNGGFPLVVGMEGCAQSVCVSYLPLDNRLKGAIFKGGKAKVMFYTINPRKDYELLLPLGGLSKALDGI